MSILSNLFKKKINASDKDETELDSQDSDIEQDSCEAGINSKAEAEEEYEVVEKEIHPAKIICPDCGGITLEGLEFCDKCGGELQ